MESSIGRGVFDTVSATDSGSDKASDLSCELLNQTSSCLPVCLYRMRRSRRCERQNSFYLPRE